jgi:hypothetical protein
MHCTLVERDRAELDWHLAHRTAPQAVPTLSISRRRKSKMPRNPAKVLPLPVGEVSKIDCRSKIAGTASSWAWVKF